MTPIWIYWDQGWENAPRIAKECARSWESKNPDYCVYYLSNHNLSDFLDFDNSIACKFNALRVQTKTDVYRLMLLQQHGGVWVDATLYCVQPLSNWLELSDSSPVALFENPGPDRLVSSWFIAAKPDTRLVQLWLKEMLEYIVSLPRPKSPKGFRKFAMKVLQIFFSRSAKATLGWWNPTLRKTLSLTPYFIVHYSYNRLYYTNREFRKLANQCQRLPADPAHQVQFALAGRKIKTGFQQVASSPVYKLNWRQMTNCQSVELAVEKALKDLGHD